MQKTSLPAVTADAEPLDDRDTVFAGAGNDTVFTGDDADMISGGTGADSHLGPAAIGEGRLAEPFAAGVRAGDIEHWLGGQLPVVRVMPNQPALLRLGISGLYANEHTSEQQLRAATNIVSTTGPVIKVGSEEDIDTVTAVSGTGPAYVFLLAEALIEAAIREGMSRRVAETLAPVLGEPFHVLYQVYPQLLHQQVLMQDFLLQKLLENQIMQQQDNPAQRADLVFQVFKYVYLNPGQ